MNNKTKSERREQKRRKKKYGMKIDPGAKTLAQILKRKDEKTSRKK